MSKSASSSLSSLISLLFFYFFLITIMILFANQVVNNRGGQDSIYAAILWFAALVVPVVLLFSIISNLLRLIRERRAQSPGVVLKSRLMIYFVIMVLISAIPQALLSLSFIRVIGDTWFNDEIGAGLQNSLDITVEVQRNFVNDLEAFVYNPLFESISLRIAENPERFYTQLRQIRPSVVAVQIFNQDGREVFFGGEAGAALNYEDIRQTAQGLVVRDIRNDRSFIRIMRIAEFDTERFSVVIMEELPSGFGEKTLTILQSLERFNEYQEIRSLLYIGIVVFYAVFALPLVFLAILTGFYMSDLLIQPIANLEDATRRVAEGDFSFRILAKSREELGHLVESFNSMISELEKSRSQLLQSERISAWKDIAQRLAHEIKNPLTPIKLSAQRLQRKYESEADGFSGILENSVTSIVREVDHLAGLLTEFRDFARLPLPKPELVKLKKLIEEMLEIHQYPHIDIHLEEIDEGTEIFADPAQFRQVFGNLVKNAIDAIGQNPGELWFRSQILSSSGRKFQRIQVRDSGVGISEDDLREIFSPYFTKKEGGTGLGLAIVQRIIQDHNGEIRVESEPGQGASFYIDLPVMEAL